MVLAKTNTSIYEEDPHKKLVKGNISLIIDNYY
jgi:hypothetical protein